MVKPFDIKTGFKVDQLLIREDLFAYLVHSLARNLVVFDEVELKAGFQEDVSKKVRIRFFYRKL